jgi:hypothetical protein
MKTRWKLAVLPMAGCLLGSYACVGAVSLGSPEEPLGLVMPPWSSQPGPIADLPAPDFGPPDSAGQIPGGQRPYPLPELSVKPDPASAGRGPVTFKLIPTTWDVEFMLIPTQWDARVFLVPKEHGIMQREVTVLAEPSTENKPRSPAVPDQPR